MVSQIGKQFIFRGPDDFEIDIPPGPGGNVPSFSDLFEDEPSSGGASDLSIRTFNKQDKVTVDPADWYKDPEFYKTLLTGEGDISKKVHQLLQDFLKATDPQDKSMFRARLIPAFWELYATVAGRIGQRLPDAKLMLLRWAIVLPTAIEGEHRKLLASIPFRNETGEPVFYADEWLKEVAFGRVSSSSIDETKVQKGNDGARQNALLEKARGKYESSIALANSVGQEMVTFEKMLLDHAQNVNQHRYLSDLGNIITPYDEGQRASFTEIGEMLRRLSLSNRKLQTAHSDIIAAKEQLDALGNSDDDDNGGGEADSKAAMEEINTVKQMIKMSVGRQGNHFPMLMKTYARGNIRDITTRENAINNLKEIEFLDPGIFLRTFKQQTNRIVPNILLMPCYGDSGICWEPFEKHNRATSRGRLILPLYPKDVRMAIITGVADLRWQVAKEKAQHYWMEEGLTGWYYQYFSDKKLKGDVKDQFILDYVLWVTKESEGMQKLEKEVREIFWRFMPFPQEVKDKLKTRGAVYAELCKKDFNRSISDGY